MKLNAHREGLAVARGVVVVTANLPKDTLVAITGNRTVDKAGANAQAIGRLVVPAKTAGGNGTVETRFKEWVEIRLGAALTAGAQVKIGAPDPTTGENTVVAFVSGTDGIERLYGVVWKGGASGAVGEVLTY